MCYSVTLNFSVTFYSVKLGVKRPLCSVKHNQFKDIWGKWRYSYTRSDSRHVSVQQVAVTGVECSHPLNITSKE